MAVAPSPGLQPGRSRPGGRIVGGVLSAASSFNARAGSTEEPRDGHCIPGDQPRVAGARHLKGRYAVVASRPGSRMAKKTSAAMQPNSAAIVAKPSVIEYAPNAAAAMGPTMRAIA